MEIIIGYILVVGAILTYVIKKFINWKKDVLKINRKEK